MIGLALLGIGAVLLWAALTGRADRVLTALSMSVPAAVDKLTPPTTAGDNLPKTTASGSSGTDSGSHMGIDPNGNIIVINKDYGSMSAAEKDAANAFAHKIGNIG